MAEITEMVSDFFTDARLNPATLQEMLSGFLAVDERTAASAEEQIIGVLREQEAGRARTEEVCRRHGISTRLFTSMDGSPMARRFRILF